jgi:hypothetical protein
VICVIKYGAIPLQQLLLGHPTAAADSVVATLVDVERIIVEVLRAICIVFLIDLVAATATATVNTPLKCKRRCGDGPTTSGRGAPTARSAPIVITDTVVVITAATVSMTVPQIYEWIARLGDAVGVSEGGEGLRHLTAAVSDWKGS